MNHFMVYIRKTDTKPYWLKQRQCTLWNKQTKSITTKTKSKLKLFTSASSFSIWSEVYNSMWLHQKEKKTEKEKGYYW